MEQQMKNAVSSNSDGLKDDWKSLGNPDLEDEWFSM